MGSEYIKIGFVEDNELLLENYKEYFESNGQFICVFAGGSIAEIVEKSKNEPIAQPDIILLDIQLPRMNGIDGISVLNELFPDAQIVMMTAFEDQDNLLNSISNGASGFLTKNMSLNAVKESVLNIFENGAALSPSAAKTLIQTIAQKRTKINSIINNLTPREKEIAKSIKMGLSYNEIAQKLYISSRTVNQHLKHIYQKIGVNSRAQLAAKMEE
ncbi:MAG: response regulator [Sphingobacteriaceae bacterium]